MVLSTERLILRQLTLDDAEFILRLVNDPAWVQYIGDKNVRTLADARAYIENGPLAMYRRRGFGLNLVALKDSGVPIGIWGLIRRDTLDDVDLGFAFLPEYRSQGYAFESAAATMAHGKDALNLSRLLAITSPGNVASTQLLGKLGFRFERLLRLTEGAPEVKLYAASLCTGLSVASGPAIVKG